MKKMSLTALLVVVLSVGAFAHEGSLGLYTDVSATDCDADFTPYLGYDITMMYFRSDGGPNGISSAEFKVEVPLGQIVISSFTPSPEASVTLGDITTGLSVSFSGCTGTGADYVLIGTINVLPFVATPLSIRVLAADPSTTLPPYDPKVTECDVARTVAPVLGGWFQAPNGSCSVGTEESSWGAIKEMYKD
jgi:hypothetical protein